ncbi:hypothetical protein DQ04_01661070 [Trypanosoma grayi]|uniref:hypothetical protein n=1 Tax=Trypanosoma grayi TaxID=71804 RepID=UPI0004F42FEC|nr:hypothetical protein DQ04_01661070 [Trypanosoma grayi]KEG12503.1 hypothetical protein DQ04_01661070 [Trypanosoma grayi]
MRRCSAFFSFSFLFFFPLRYPEHTDLVSNEVKINKEKDENDAEEGGATSGCERFRTYWVYGSAFSRACRNRGVRSQRHSAPLLQQAWRFKGVGAETGHRVSGTEGT